MNRMRISQQQVNEFARWSGDCNPIHVDPEAAKASAFGGNIVHGTLSTMEALRLLGNAPQEDSPVSSLSVEFRGEIRPGHEYELQSDVGKDRDVGNDRDVENDRATVVVSKEGRGQMSITIEWGASEIDSQSMDWASGSHVSRLESSTGDQPVRWDPKSFRSGHQVHGIHRFGDHDVASDSKLTDAQEKVLGLCSFMVGMKAPGLASLFTRLEVDFAVEGAPAQDRSFKADSLAYRLTFLDFDFHFRLLTTRLEIALPDGQPVAVAEMQSYVRFQQDDPDPETYSAGAIEKGSSLSSNVSLVCGASRGLGAELAAGLAAFGGTVYIACRNPNDQTQRLASRIQEQGGHANIVVGDLSDSAWCAELAQQIARDHGRLDTLVLNACAPPRPADIVQSDEVSSADYIARNAALFQTPLIRLLPLVSDSDGTVLAVSSSFVDELPAGFADYVAVKMALEAVIQTAANEHRSTQFIIARPPKLQTSWNDTPTSAMGAIPTHVAATHMLRAIANPSEDSNVAILTEFPDESTQDVQEILPEDVEPEPKHRVVVAASFTLDPLEDGIQFWSNELDMRLKAEFAPYAQVLQQALDPTSSMSRSKDGSAILLRVSDWLRELPADQLQKPEEVANWLQSTTEEHIQALRNHRGIAQGPTLLLLCPSTFRPELDNSLLEELETHLLNSLDDLAGLTIVQPQLHHEKYDVPDTEIYDGLREDLAHMPYQDGYYHFLATLITRFFHSQFSRPKKVVVLDCDNTLWQGVVGEAGPEGIVFTPPQLRLQRRLTELANCGVLLCLCSKNEEDDVWSVFEQRSDFELDRDQIVAAAVNWLPKSQNLHSLAQNLNLGLDSFVFLDDNPVECAEVRSGCPQVLTLQWPQDPDAAHRLLDHTWELDPRATTEEDKRRTQLYREEFQRQQAQQSTGNFQDFIDSLDLVVQIDPLSDADLPRASQLTMRTNQFNFTTRRRTESEIKELQTREEVLCRTVRVRDRFGDYGLVGFLIAVREGDCLEVDTFLLSCRVLGRGVEHRMAAEIGVLASDQGLAEVEWRHLPTARNTPARLFLSQLTDEEAPAKDDWMVRIRADALAGTEFQAPQAADEEPQATGAKSDAGSAAIENEETGPRQREQQILRTANELASYAGLVHGIAGDDESVLASATETDGIEETVIETFAKALRKTEAEIRQQDRLEALGCDSLRVVEITVALTKHYAWLPKTLLFEHRSVSDIVAAIVQVAGGAEQGTAEQGTGGRGTAATVRSSVSSPKTEGADEIAIVGIGVACAGAASVEGLWRLLEQGISGVGRVPTARESFVGRLNDPRPHFAGLVEKASEFDPEFFDISPREAEYLDPQLRRLLQTAWHALEDAGSANPDEQAKTGVFVGVMYSGYAQFANVVANQLGSVYRCWEGFSLANRVSQVLSAGGPSLSVDTACSSSATALHYACQSLAKGDCETAMVSGVNLIVNPDRLVQFGRLGILSPSGNCVPFGDQADGTVLGEGAVTIILRPLEEAKRRGDRVYALIKGTGISSGAGSVGFTAPNPTAQSKAARQAIVNAGIDPRTVNYIETHGTGTELGDPIEVRGLEMAYCDRRLWQSGVDVDHQCALGSIKPNVGHLEAGAGLMGVVKAALQLQQGTLVKSLSSPSTNPQIPFDQLPFHVQKETTDWTRVNANSKGKTIEVPRRAGVNSFGVGGSNAHVILEEYPKSKARKDSVNRPAHVLALSAHSEPALQLQWETWSESLNRSEAVDLQDICFSANVGRDHQSHRMAVVVSEDSDGKCSPGQPIVGARSSSVESKSGAGPGTTGVCPAFLFTGQGAQYPTMLHDVYQSSPVFKDALDECAGYLDSLLPQPLKEVMFEPQEGSSGRRIDQTRFTQPALFAVQYSLWQLWDSWGIHAQDHSGSCLIGHSIGEVAAYCVAGGCSLRDALKLVEARGRLMQELPAGGTMCSIAASHEIVREELGRQSGSVSIAAQNGPESTVISGPEQEVAHFAETFGNREIKSTMLAVSHAFHSSLMEPMLDEFRAVLDQLEFNQPKLEIISTVTGQRSGAKMATPEYWLEQVRSTVRFMDAMQTAAECQPITHFVELGPHPVLLGMGRACLPDYECDWLPSARRGREDWPVLLESLGRYYAGGGTVDWRSFDAPYETKRVWVPGYTFDSRRIWLSQLDEIGDANQDAGSVSSDLKNLLYDISWKKQALPASAARDSGVEGKEDPNSSHANWLICACSDEGPTSSAIDQMTRRLQAGGIRVEHMVLDALDANKIDQWTQKAVQADRVVVLADLGSGIGTDSNDMPDAAISIVQKTCRLIRAAAETNQMKDRSFWIVTADSAIGHPETQRQDKLALLGGIATVAAQECDGWWGGLIDLKDWLSEPDGWFAEIKTPAEDEQIVIRGDQRWVRRLERAPTLDRIEVGSLRFDGQAVLITGGLGGVGSQFARWFAEHGAKTLILASRSGRPTPGSESWMEDLADNGTSVIPVAADVSTPEGVNRCFDAAGNTAIDVIVHAAGVDLEKPLAECSADDVERLLAAKVKGGWSLHQEAMRRGVEKFICLSSISSIWGSMGRGLYAAGNAFLDGLVQARRAAGHHGLALNFGPWEGAGMASPEALAELARMGNHGLSPEVALSAVECALLEDRTQVVVANMDWQRFLGVMEAKRSVPLFQELASESSRPNTDVGASGQQSRQEGSSPKTKEPAWIVELRGLDLESRPAAFERQLAGELASALGKGPDTIDSETGFREQGLDSLGAAEFANLLRNKLQLERPPKIFRHANLKELSLSLFADLPNLDSREESEETLQAKEDVSIVDHQANHSGGTNGRVKAERGVVRFHAGMEQRVFDFCKKAWPHRRSDWIESRWRWMFLDSASRLGTDPTIWLMQENDQIVGHHGAQFVRLKMGQETVTTAYLVETMILPEHRDRGIGTELLIQSEVDMPMNLSLGQTAQMRSLMDALGWQKVGTFQTYLMMLHPSRVLAGKLPSALVPSASAWFGLRRRLAQRSSNHPESDPEIRKVDRFSEVHDRLWDQVAKDYCYAVVRDASFLNWKYIDQPGQSFQCFDVIVQGVFIGAFVLDFDDPDDVYPYRRARIVDLLVGSGSHDLDALIHAAVNIAAEEQADAVVMQVRNGPIEASLIRSGFLKRDATREMWVCLPPSERSSSENILQPEGWLLTQGDSDIDRPW